MSGCAEAFSRTDCCSRVFFIAICEIGLPAVQSRATEQQSTTTERAGPSLATEQQRQLKEATRKILRWLDLVSTSIQAHKETASYKDAARRAGSTHQQTGLNAQEHEDKVELANAKGNLRNAELLARQWNAHEITYDSVNLWQWNLLWDYWNGTLQRTIDEIKSRRASTELHGTTFRVHR